MLSGQNILFSYGDEDDAGEVSDASDTGGDRDVSDLTLPASVAGLGKGGNNNGGLEVSKVIPGPAIPHGVSPLDYLLDGPGSAGNSPATTATTTATAPTAATTITARTAQASANQPQPAPPATSSPSVSTIQTPPGPGHAPKPSASNEKEKAIRERVGMEKLAWEIQGELIERRQVEPYILARACRHLQPSHYRDVVEERALMNRCGRPTCGNPIPERRGTSGKYRIQAKELKVYDVSVLHSFCSQTCMVLSEKLENEMDTTAVYSRRDNKDSTLASVFASHPDPVTAIDEGNGVTDRPVLITERSGPPPQPNLDFSQAQRTASAAIDGHVPRDGQKRAKGTNVAGDGSASQANTRGGDKGKHRAKGVSFAPSPGTVKHPTPTATTTGSEEGVKAEEEGDSNEPLLQNVNNARALNHGNGPRMVKRDAKVVQQSVGELQLSDYQVMFTSLSDWIGIDTCEWADPAYVTPTALGAWVYRNPGPGERVGSGIRGFNPDLLPVFTDHLQVRWREFLYHDASFAVPSDDDAQVFINTLQPGFRFDLEAYQPLHWRTFAAVFAHVIYHVQRGSFLLNNRFPSLDSTPGLVNVMSHFGLDDSYLLSFATIFQR